MKARVIATGEIIEVERIGYFLNGHRHSIEMFMDNTGCKYPDYELDFQDSPDYWERLKHQYAGMAMMAQSYIFPMKNFPK